MKAMLGLLVLFATFSLGCVDDKFDEAPVDTGVRHVALEHGELFYVQGGGDRVVLAAERPFEQIEFHVSLGDVDFRVLDRDGGVVLDWQDAETFNDDSAPASHEGSVTLPRAGHRIELRAASAVEFGRFFVSNEAHVHEGEGDEIETPEGAGILFSAISGRWIPDDEALQIANQQYLPYTGSPSRCSGTFLPGTREVADFLKREFEGARSYGGYACRANTANTSQLSVHASGRAIDLFVPLDGDQADNDLGDPIANYLIANSEELGIEFIVWDRTSWGAHREAPKHRAYTGPHPHHDHLHIELSPNSASRTGRTFPPIIRDNPPIGYLDAADCESISGWAQDPDAPDQPIQVYISIGGPVFTEGAAGYFVDAKNRREDLCGAIGSCEHGFSLPTPRGLMDGVPREVYVYGMDATGPRNSELNNAPRTLQCDPPSLPFPPSYGVLRHVANPEVFEAWSFDWHDVASIGDAELSALPKIEAIPDAPSLVRADGEPGVYLVESGLKRHVPNPATMDHWRFDWASIQIAAHDELLEGVKVTPRPFLARGSDDAVYLVEPPPPLWADQYAWEAPTRLGSGQTAYATLTLRNRGSLAWNPELFELRPSSASVSVGVEPGVSVSLQAELTAPTTLGTHEFCFELVHDGFTFRDAPPCLTVQVVEDAVDVEGFGPDLTAEDADAPLQIQAGAAGCNAAGGAPAAWTLLLILLGFRRRSA